MGYPIFLKRRAVYLFAGRVLWALWFMTLAASARAGIPEPDLVWYGKVWSSSGGTPVRVTSGTLVWQIEPLTGGPAIVLTTPLTNINNQFSYVLRVPCETPVPGVSASTTTVNLTVPASRYRRMTVKLNGQALSLISAPGEFSTTTKDRSRSEQIDLQSAGAMADTDGDGLDDEWEQAHFGSLGANPMEDPDGDGVTNLGEFRAGTDPKNPDSVLQFVEISKAPDGALVRWSSQAGRHYRVRRASSLLASMAEYEVVKSGLAGTPTVNEFLDTTAPSASTAFYLIELEN